MNLLFTCAGRRNYLIDYFKESMGADSKIFAADMQISAPALSVADVSIIVPDVYSKNYIRVLLDACLKHQIDAIISLNDLELPILEQNRKAFSEIEVQLVISSKEVIEICFDKWKTFNFARSIDVLAPHTFITLESAKDSFERDKLKFPVVVKPRWGSASIGIEYAEDINELEMIYNFLSIKLKRTILSKVSGAEIDHAILIQEKIYGTEYGIDILNDFDGNTVEIYIKEKLAMRAGETDKAVLRNIPELERLAYKIGNSLKHIGNLDCDVFTRNGEYFLLELNPRFGGGYPFSHISGADFPSAICAWIEGNRFNTEGFTKKYDQAYAKCDTLIKVVS